MNNPQWQFGEGNEYLALDFARCQRPDGSYYGTGGVCRQGSSVGAKEKKASSGKSGGSKSESKSGGGSGGGSSTKAKADNKKGPQTKEQKIKRLNDSLKKLYKRQDANFEKLKAAAPGSPERAKYSKREEMYQNQAKRIRQAGKKLGGSAKVAS